MEIPYCIVKGGSRLGTIVLKKTAAVLCLTSGMGKKIGQAKMLFLLSFVLGPIFEEHLEEDGCQVLVEGFGELMNQSSGVLHSASASDESEVEPSTDASIQSNDNINTIHAEIIADLKDMLDNCNALVKSFQNVRDKFRLVHSDVTMKLLGNRGFDPRRYNLPSISEVAAVIPRDLDKTISVSDIVLQTQSGTPQHITKLNPSYLALQYPLLFPYAEDGYREDISFAESELQRAGGRTDISL
ncbi:hypothetical protein ACS0TY_018631 [Phlomoides rotata]